MVVVVQDPHPSPLPTLTLRPPYPSPRPPTPTLDPLPWDPRNRVLSCDGMMWSRDGRGLSARLLRWVCLSLSLSLSWTPQRNTAAKNKWTAIWLDFVPFSLQGNQNEFNHVVEVKNEPSSDDDEEGDAQMKPECDEVKVKFAWVRNQAISLFGTWKRNYQILFNKHWEKTEGQCHLDQVCQTISMCTPVNCLSAGGHKGKACAI